MVIQWTRKSDVNQYNVKNMTIVKQQKFVRTIGVKLLAKLRTTAAKMLYVYLKITKQFAFAGMVTKEIH